MPLIGSGLLTAGGAPEFVGAYDGISNLAAVYSVRRVLTSYTGPLLRLRRDSDNAESDFGYVANGDLDTAAITAWLGGATGYVTTWYDQAVSGLHATQAVAGSQPQYVASISGGNGPSLSFNNDNFPTGVAISSDFSVIVAGKNTSDTSNRRVFVGARTATIDWRIKSNGTTCYAGASYDLVATYTGNFSIFSAIDSISYYQLGVLLDSDATNINWSTYSASFYLGINGPLSTAYLIGNLSEVVLLSTQLSTADHNTIGASMASYYGLTWNTIS